MGKVTNRFFITTIQDGQSMSAALMATSVLTQSVSDGGGCAPNWNYGETGAVNPVVWVYSRLNGVLKAPTAGTWYWNGVPITFDGNGHSAITDAAGNHIFELTTHSHTLDGVTLAMPAIKIVRNLANASGNTDNDIISYKGSLEIGGVGQEFGVDTVVRITQLTGTGYAPTHGGDLFVSSDVAGAAGYTAYVYAQLYEGTTPVDGLTTLWYREGVDDDSVTTPGTGGTWPKSGVAVAVATTMANGTVVPAHSYYTTVNASEIVDNVVLRCDFYKNGTKVASVWHAVDDETDPEAMYIVNSTGSTVGQSDIVLRASQTVVVKAWMAYNTNMYTRHAAYTTFKCKLTDAQGATITTGVPIPDGKTVTNGFFDITNNSMTVADKNGNELLAAGVGGEISIAASDVDARGGGIGGVIMAATTSE